MVTLGGIPVQVLRSNDGTGTILYQVGGKIAFNVVDAAKRFSEVLAAQVVEKGGRYGEPSENA